MSETTQSIQHNATALLATVRRLMTCKEIETCELLAGDASEWSSEPSTSEIYTADEVDELECEFTSKLQLLKSLEIQFSREIAKWKDGVPA